MKTKLPPVTEADYQAATKLTEDYWTQFDPTTEKKIKNLGITDGQYNSAVYLIKCYENRDRDNVTSHALARFLLEHPDCPVLGLRVGQGSNEMGDDHLKEFAHTTYEGTPVITLEFGWGPLTE